MISTSAVYAAEHAKRGRTPIAQVKISNVVVAQSAIFTPDSAGTLSDSLGGCWTLDEATGNRLDLTSASNDLVPFNTPSYIAGKIGNAVALVRASSQDLRCSATTALQTGNRDWTVAVWVKFDAKPAAGNFMHIVYSTSNAGADSWRLAWDNTVLGPTADRFKLYLVTGSGAVTDVLEATTFGAPSTGVWYFIMAGRNKVTGEYFISVNNGTPDTKVSAVVTAAGAPAFYVGSNTTQYWDGAIDELRFWSKLLSTAEQADLYNGGSGNQAVAGTVTSTLSTNEFCTRRPITKENIGLELLEPLELVQQVDPDKSRFALPTFTFTLTDIDGVITSFVSNGVAGLRCEVFVGYWDLPWYVSPVNYVQLFYGIITEVEHEAGRYRFTARSPMAAAQDKIILDGAQTRLTGDITSTDTTVPAADTSAFETPAASPDSAIKIFLIDNEVLSARGKTATSFTSVIRATGAGGSLGYPIPPVVSISSSHSSGAFIKELIKLGEIAVSTADAATDDTMHPMKLLRGILTDSGKRGIGESGIPLNAASLAAAQTRLGNLLQFRFVYANGVNVKKLIEEELCAPTGSYPIENELGELSVKLFQGVDSANIVDSITDSHIVSFPKWLRNSERMVNKVVIHYDYMPTIDQYTSTFSYTDDTLVDEIGREIVLEINSKGIRSQYSQSVPIALTWFEATAAFLTDLAQRYIARFGVQAPIIQLTALASKQLLQVGDDVEVTCSQAINLGTAERQLTNAKFEIISMRHLFQEGLIEMELLGYPDV